jgi:formylglycine-generating enzyme required for sulfatase activity
MKTRNRATALLVLVSWVIVISCQTVMNLSPVPTPIPPIVQKFAKAEKDGMMMAYVEQGEFIMGSDNGEPNERPTHMVYLDSYWIDQTEVTNKMYRLCITYGNCEPPLADGFYVAKDHYTNPAQDNYPVTYINWIDANAYCKWAGRRLPTEAEWEKAARGADGRTYPWGNQEPTAELLNFNNNNGGKIIVGSFPLGASPYGVLDMAGNVSELVADWYDKDYYFYLIPNNPKGPTEGETHSKRGGAYFDAEYSIRTTIRYQTNPTYKLGIDIGFRCAADVDYIPSETNRQHNLALTWFWK